MVIWIDLDEVLAELAEAMLLENDYYIWWKRISFDDITNYYLYEIKDLNVSINEALELFKNTLLSDIGKLEIKPVEGVYNKLKEWKEKWYRLKVITARPKDLFEKYTRDWINKYYPNIFDEIYFANDSKEKMIGKDGVDNTKKSIICKNLGVDVMIEDNPEYAKEIADCWIKTFLIRKPWNKHIESSNNLVVVDRFENINL